MTLAARLGAIAPLFLFALHGGGCGSAPPAPVASATPPPQAASAAPKPAPAGLAPADVDARIRAAWAREGITPAPQADDARFLRRAYLDITGVIPSVDAVTTFLADSAADKRSKLVASLLASPRYANHWTDLWDRVLLGRDVRGRLVDRDAFRGWLHGELAKNAGWDRMVTDLLTATGESRSEETGAVNWFVKYRDTPQDLAGSASKIFLGVQIQCAQCHDHKTEKWKTEDFRRFAACFAKTRTDSVGDADMKQKTFAVSDADNIAMRKRKEPEIKAIVAAAPTALDGTDFSSNENRRQALAAWMTAPDNPWFARAAVNRLWAHFLGRGFVDPITDFRPGNPAVVPELLDALARDFVASGHDIQRLIRLICATEVYQRAALGAGRDRLWSRFRTEPLAPDELLDSLVVATKADAVAERRKKSLDAIRERLDKQISFLFDVDEESDEADYDGSIPQALFLLNGGFVNSSARAIPGSALAEVLALPGGDDEKIQSLYLRTLSRVPDASEIASARELLATPAIEEEEPPSDPKLEAKANVKEKAKGKAPKVKSPGKGAAVVSGRAVPGKTRAYEDLFWALLNSSEFALNH
ncbi:MAG: DUF1549 and DUF1553 domain-containing protein [Byssovorax sp.]